MIPLLLASFSLQVVAQEEPHFKVAFGVNMLNNSSKKPWTLDGFETKAPLYFGVDYQANRKWSFGVNGLVNKLKVDGVTSHFFCCKCRY